MVRHQRTQTALDPAVQALIPRLAAGLALMQDMEHLIIETAQRGRYVQFAAWDGCLRAESVGNAYLAPEDAMECEDWDWLVEHGWNPEDEGGNLWREWTPARPLEAATVAAITLAEVHGFGDVDCLRILAESRAVLDAITKGAR